MLSLLAAALLTIPDAAGDTRGDGSYTLPTRPALSAGALDLRELKVENQGGKLRLTIGLGAVQNPWNAPLGYSAGVIDIFVKSRLGGATALAKLGFVTPPQQGWQYHLHLNGFGSSLEFVPDGQTAPQPRNTPLTVQLSGSAVVIDTPIPAGQYSYWVTNSVYSPFTPDGMLHPGTGGGSASLIAPRNNGPIPVDVISGGDQARAYATGVLQPVGRARDRRALLLLGLAAAGLLLGLIATVRVWRKSRV
ncbi:glucodextranase DOMON-like domain-containing protein [Deinococcus sp.]|uniref:glucodextranase DOMON-like domain-containing protein n=1 Tax=Deinococcus sp. TaxID=47478 RepID=UPI003C7D0696